MAKKKPGLGKVLILLTGSLLMSAVGAEVLYRLLSPAPFEMPKTLRPDGTSFPLAEMAVRIPESGERPADPTGQPRGLIKPNLVAKHWYDRPEWDYFDDEGCVDVTSNSLGFRDLEFSAEKAPDEFRVLTVGDSFTFGSGVQLEDSWPQILERMLRESMGRPVEAINGGYAAGSYWPPGYLDWISKEGIALQPDVLVIGLCLNDMHREIPMLSYPNPPEPWLGGVSQLLYFFQTKWNRSEIDEANRQAAASGRRRDYADFVRHLPQEWEQTKAACVEINRLMREHDIRFVLAVFPMLSELGDLYPYLGLHEMVAEFCEANDIEHVDLLPKFRGRDERELWVHATDQHPNHIGNRLLAEGIFEYLTAK